MSDSPNTWDPYVAPQVPTAVASGAPLPTGLKAVCIIAIILGVGGLFASCLAAVNLAVGPSLQSAFQVPGAENDEQGIVRAQQDMQRQILAASQPFRPGLIVSVLLHVAAALALLFGGILTLKVSATGRLTLLSGCLVAIGYEVLQAVLNVLIQFRTIPLVQDFMERAMPPGGPTNLPPAIGKAMVVGMFVGLAFALALTLVKIAFYVFSIVYLKKSPIAARFGAQ
jgi:hypothetical protein